MVDDCFFGLGRVWIGEGNGAIFARRAAGKPVQRYFSWLSFLLPATLWSILLVDLADIFLVDLNLVIGKTCASKKMDVFECLLIDVLSGSHRYCHNMKHNLGIRSHGLNLSVVLELGCII